MGTRSTHGSRGVLREVVSRVKGTGHASLQLGVAVVRRLDDGELEAAGILEVQVKLAVLGLVRRHGAGTGVELEGIETECDDLVCLISCGSRSPY